MPSTICEQCGGFMDMRQIGDNYGVGTEFVCYSCGYIEQVDYTYFNEMRDE